LWYAIVTDDLTGAADSAARCLPSGLRARVSIGGDASAWYDVEAFDTDTRHLPPAMAGEIVAGVVEHCLRMGAVEVYKKVDSVLRGNVGAELEATMRAAGAELVLLCPAFPEQGRTVVEGHLLVNDTPVTATSLGREVGASSYVPEILGAQTSLPVGLLGLRSVRSGHEVIVQELEALRRSGARIVVADACSGEDLAAVADGARALGRSCLLAGSAGLISALAPHWARALPPPQVLVVVGSLHPTARAQVRLLLEKESCALVRTGNDEEPDDSSRVIVLLTPDEGTEGDHVGELAKRAAQALRSRRVSGMVVTGGDSARAVLEAIGASGVALLGEVVPGLPCGRLVGGDYDGLPVVTKAGSFGREEALWWGVIKVEEMIGER